MAQPPMTRNSVIFPVSLAALVLAVPFVDRNDWQRWFAFFVIIAAVGWIVGIRLLFVIWAVREWWAGRDLD